MQSAIVFGGSGFIGSYVADALSNQGYNVIIADLYEPASLNPRQTFVKVDIFDEQAVHEIVERADFVFNFAAIANLDDAINLPKETLQVNVIANLNILEACRKAPHLQRFVYASSAYAVSADGSFYGISKYTSEKITEEYHRLYGINYTIIRYGSVYGERPSHNNYLYNLIYRAIKSGVLQYKGDGSEVREYIHAADAAQLTLEILEKDTYLNQNIILTGIERLRRLELITMINEILRGKLEIQQLPEDHQGHYKITPYSWHPVAAKKLVANPFTDLGQGLLECIKSVTHELENESELTSK